MKKIITFNPSISSLNRGDDVIVDSSKRYLSKIFPDAFMVDISSHLPVSNMFMRFLDDFKLRFVLGSNLMASNMNSRFRQWDITIPTMKKVGPVVLMGVGWRLYQDDINFYTRYLYRNVLSKELLHSVRDEYAENKLKKAGFKNVIMTGCPSLWGFTPDYCETIPQKKAKNVVTTITDYVPDPKSDVRTIKMLKETYENVYLWVQGSRDIEYLKEIGMLNEVKLINPQLEAYDNFLVNNAVDTDFVGTRLHGGVRALQKGLRTIIIGIDNRSLEIKKSCNIPVCDKNDFTSLVDMINNGFETKIKIPQQNIEQWLKQFQNME